jgi:uncharacterized membrane protein YeaQ/YmgE (transglycosylase-associated protein family)
MGFLTWVVLGLAAGVLAKLIMPGRDPGGVIVTPLIGVAGAVVGGFVGTRLGLGTVTGMDLRSVALAVGGAFVLLLIFRLVKKL